MAMPLDLTQEAAKLLLIDSTVLKHKKGRSIVSPWDQVLGIFLQRVMYPS